MTRNRNTASQLAAAALAALLVGPLAVHSARAERPPPLQPGTVWAGEDKSHGQRGDDTTTDSHMPVQAANPDHLDVVDVVAPAADADDSLVIRPGNTPPVAIAYVLDEDDNNLGTEVALDFSDHAGTTVLLDGSASFDPDGDALSFQWSVASPSGWLFNAEEPTTAGVFDLGVHIVTHRAWW